MDDVTGIGLCVLIRKDVASYFLHSGYVQIVFLAQTVQLLQMREGR